MRSTFAIVAAAALILLAPAVGTAEEGTTQGTIEVGAWDASTDGSPDVVTEYETTDGGPDVRLDVETVQDWGSLLLSAHALDSDDQSYGLAFDIGRALRSETTYGRFIHRLGHDPLANLEAVTNHGRAVWHTDLDPAGEYDLSYRLLEHRSELQLPAASAVTLGFIYRDQERKGTKQALTVSHCDACHVYSQGQSIDEQTEDAGLDATLAWKGGQVKASFVHRELTQGGAATTLLFDDALHPELRLPLFDNRVAFDSAQGPLPVHQRPEISKDTGKLELSLPDVGGFAINAGGVWTTTENDLTGLESDYRGYMVNAAKSFKKAWRFRWRGRAYSIDNDDVFVDIAEPVGVAGPQAGRTYREIYGYDPDFLRQSSLNRDVLESRLELAYRAGKKAGTVKLLWNFENVDREFFEVASGESETTENVFGVTWWGRPRKGLRLDAAYRHGEVDNPFTNVDGTYSTLFSAFAASPFAPTAAQYYEFQDARIADVSAVPASWDELKLGFAYTFGNRALTASYRYWDGSNDEGDLADWSRTNQTATVSYFAAPTPQWQWNLAYTYFATELELPTTIPIFDG